MPLFAALLLPLLPACSDDDTQTPKPEPDPVWSELDNLPSAVTLYSLWAPRDDLVIGVGPHGNIWQWGGQRWTQLANPSAEDLYAIAGSPTGTVLAVGDNGTVLEQSQGSFVQVQSGARDDLRGVWRSASGLVVAVGSNGTIIRRTGSTWSADDVPTGVALFGIWGSSDTDIFAVGLGGTILHHDGNHWSEMTSPATGILAAVDGTASNDVWAVGAGGVILHYDGNEWSLVPSGTTQLLQSVCADCGPAVAGANGIVLRRANGTWSPQTVAGAPWLYAIAGAGVTQWVAGTGTLYRYDGVQWSNMNRGTVPMLRSVASSVFEGLVAAGDNGKVMVRGPKHWRMEDAGQLMRLNSIIESSGGEIFAAGTNRIFRYADGVWVVENSDITEYFDLGESGGSVFAVGNGGAIRWRHNGTWDSITRVVVELHAVGMNEQGGYIAGAEGTILEFDPKDQSLETIYTRAGTTLWDIMPVQTDQFRAIAVGANGVSLGRSTEQGVGWINMPTFVSTTLYALAYGPGGNLYAAGANGTVLRLANDQWSIMPPPTPRTFRGACSRDGVLYLCGGSTAAGGMVFRYGPPDP